MKITKKIYEFALGRIEYLLPLVDDNTPTDDNNAIELMIMSDIVVSYEKEHYPIAKPTPVTFRQSRQTVAGAQL